MRKLLSIVALAMVLVVPNSMATKKKVLFIGNSYTYTNNMPLMLQNLATAMGDTLVYDESDPGGYTMQQHTIYAPTITKIFSQPWDVVVIQEQSQLPAFDPSQVANEVLPYATRLDSMVNANDTCTQTMYMMTWGRPTGDHSNCAFYPPICTYQGMQQRLRESYMQMALDNDGLVAPVGMAFKVMIDSAYTPWLYSPDSSHPAVAGSYIEACVLYGSIFHKRTLNAAYLGGLTAADARLLQRIADKVVFDSMALWQQTGNYPYAGFTHTIASSTATFASTPITAVTHSWNMGDMTTDTAANPVHIYAATGTYVVSHTVSNDCFSETMKDTVYIGTTSINTITGKMNGSIIAQGGGTVRFALQLEGHDQLDIVDMKGVVVRRYSAQSLPATDNLVPGLYVYRLYSHEGGSVSNGKVMVY